jgi:hypothetical protein
VYTYAYGTVPYPIAGYVVAPSAYARTALTPRAYKALGAAVRGIRAPSYSTALASAVRRAPRLTYVVRGRRVRLPATAYYLAPYLTLVPYTRPSSYLATLAPNVTRYALR